MILPLTAYLKEGTCSIYDTDVEDRIYFILNCLSLQHELADKTTKKEFTDISKKRDNEPIHLLLDC
jgi:hypothetical protein